jgi:hypothetical protein
MPRTFGLPHMSAPLRAGVGHSRMAVASRRSNYRLSRVRAAASDEEDVRLQLRVGLLLQ